MSAKQVYNLKIPTGGKNSLTLPKSDKSINKVHTTDELAKLAGVGHIHRIWGI